MRTRAELIRALAVLCEPPTAEHRRLAEVLALADTPEPESYAETFLFQLYPFASVYLGPEGMLGGDARDRVGGTWRALGRRPPAEPDHLGALLGLYAALAESAERTEDAAEGALWEAAAAGVLWEHLLSWAMPYLDRFDDLAAPAYRGWARLLRETLREEALRHGQPTVLPLHLRHAPGLPDPRSEGGEAFVSGLLAPVRSGLMMARADLARCASDVGLGLRIGERRFVLNALLAQEPSRTLEWLSTEATAWTDRHAKWAPDLGPVAEFWTGRALSARNLIDGLLGTDLRGIGRGDENRLEWEVGVDARN